MQIEGKVWKFGDSLDTDQIIPARYLHIATAEEMKCHCLEDARPEFVAHVEQGDLIIGGNNFGCGSSREEAPAMLKKSGIQAVIAASFARIFLRNALNIGLAVIECPRLIEETAENERLRIDFETGLITNLHSGRVYQSAPLPPFLQHIIHCGGLLPYVAEELRKTAVNNR